MSFISRAFGGWRRSSGRARNNVAGAAQAAARAAAPAEAAVAVGDGSGSDEEEEDDTGDVNANLLDIMDADMEEEEEEAVEQKSAARRQLEQDVERTLTSADSASTMKNYLSCIRNTEKLLMEKKVITEPYLDAEGNLLRKATSKELQMFWTLKRQSKPGIRKQTLSQYRSAFNKFAERRGAGGRRLPSYTDVAMAEMRR